MFPEIHFGFLHIPSYGLMVLLGLIALVITTIIIFEKIEKKEKQVTNRILLISIPGFVILVLSAFVFNSIFHSIEERRLVLGGITWLGGVLGGFPAMIFLIHKFSPLTKGEALETFELLIPGIILAHAFGRIGCFLGGCCYGGVTDSIFGISFPAGSVAANQYPATNGASLPVFPTQLFEAAFDLLLFIVIITLFKRIKAHIFEVYAFSYGTFRFALEFIRGDDRGVTGILLSPSQLMSIVLIICGVLVLLYKRGKIFKKLNQKMKSLVFERESGKQPLTVQGTKLLRELKQLCDDGVITIEEFNEKKREILKRL